MILWGIDPDFPALIGISKMANRGLDRKSRA